jgi:hypothetical protein
LNERREAHPAEVDEKAEPAERAEEPTGHIDGRSRGVSRLLKRAVRPGVGERETARKGRCHQHANTVR